LWPKEKPNVSSKNIKESGEIIEHEKENHYQESGEEKSQ
jgi:hypothetical protein